MKKVITSGILAVSLALALEGCSIESVNDNVEAKNNKPYIVTNLEDFQMRDYFDDSVYVVDKRTGILYLFSNTGVKVSGFTPVYDKYGEVVGTNGTHETTPDQYFGLGGE